MISEPTELLSLIDVAFPAASEACRMTLRCGNQIDSYETPDLVQNPPTDWHSVLDAELEEHHWGLNYLGIESWMFYLPAFLSYAARHRDRGESLVVDACIRTLQLDPPRLKRLTVVQRKTVRMLLELLAFDPESQVQEDACQVLDEYWLPRP